jgi:hypothetical protein
MRLRGLQTLAWSFSLSLVDSLEDEISGELTEMVNKDCCHLIPFGKKYAPAQ